MSRRQTEQERHRLAGALQSALTKEDVAEAYLATVGRVIEAEGLGLYELEPERGTVIDVRATVGGEVLEHYEEFGRPDDPVLRFVIEQRRPIDSSRAASPAEWSACGAREALRIGGFGHSLEAPVMVSGLMLGTINFARRPHEPVFDGTDLTSARLVSEQLGLATERALRFEMTGHRASALEHALDRLPQAVVVTDLDANVIFQNRTARNDLDLCDVPAPVPDSVSLCIGQAMAEFRGDGKRVFTRSIRDAATGKQSIVKSYRLSERDRTAVTVVFPCREESASRQLPAWDVLTKREQEIAQLVSEGLTTKQIAAKAFISENTVKQHLKRVFAKTDVTNRAELVQLIWTATKAV
ncbi:LuxR C-terminal-related transcriptional regulator [Blastococcus goldschmidtiae]|uniref:LuxR C-terminal-related transcriptional regulator n=1 Tax=Blastococcus goldschmidtiae TaxID=3075546 RepID=A0ABU2K870_9ACTN|nr:LuxR C-terminal-related transcriptional regulator [Blastococcus sp. DSM 46792]MDT0276363.1 LuxR C-terminal-related transcriptional regulator [Blastococcus sp. DSM 46792]